MACETLSQTAIQKKNHGYDDRTGGKWDLRMLKLYLIGRFGPGRVDDLFWEIQTIVIRSLLCAEKLIVNDQHCFELFGYDILLDEHLKPWLLEVNASPSLTASTPEDYSMKSNLINDVLDVIDMERNLDGDEETIGGFDLVYEDGVVEMQSQQQGCKCYLGGATI